MEARVALGEREARVAIDSPVSLALQLDFDGPQPRHFGAPRASAKAFEAEGFAGTVLRGASCNCEVISLVPHCNGTHTECVGHLTRERLDASRVAPLGLLPALLLTVAPESARSVSEDSDPEPQDADLLVTRAALERAWPGALPFAPRALIVRTRPQRPGELARDDSREPPPYLSRQAAALLLERGIAHLVVDLPSVDRTHDQGRLTAHRIFFGLPAGSSALAQALRPAATITELACVPDEVADGACLLEIQVPALGGDAVPSRPLLYRLLP